MVKRKKSKNFIITLKERIPLLSGIISLFAVILGIFGAVFAAMGVCMVCSLPVLAFILGLFGMSVGTLSDYNLIFIGVGIFFFALSIYLYRRRKCKNGVCQLK